MWNIHACKLLNENIHLMKLMKINSCIGNIAIVQCLIEKGANIEAKNEIQRTPLHFACSKGHLPIVQYLIEKGANIEAKDKCNQRTPLHFACSKGHLPIVQYLIEEGANIEELKTR